MLPFRIYFSRPASSQKQYERISWYSDHNGYSTRYDNVLGMIQNDDRIGYNIVFPAIHVNAGQSVTLSAARHRVGCAVLEDLLLAMVS